VDEPRCDCGACRFVGIFLRIDNKEIITEVGPILKQGHSRCIRDKTFIFYYLRLAPVGFVDFAREAVFA
jgi:hypothetical protein